MKIYLNGQDIETQAETLMVLFQEQKIDSTAIATAVNGDFVPRTAYETTKLTQGAKVEVLSPMQGG
ncbi:sulfur carrier protein ThiS [Commensalibacter oyaizuii]|uniref:Sulfur carrier protein ThiS n=1 Tax=Commensalibacter oyaizuii TaxID=3043873 RepID=A0ABT6Q2J8_9PROT|nr:sulfur carrier protein ThiS [Commensalibacter sp. TBRC 16381]MDI2091355.1 sulfur carrier protein ThiS [Commensalibacter sp. TBRC 16381]